MFHHRLIMNTDICYIFIFIFFFCWYIWTRKHPRHQHVALKSITFLSQTYWRDVKWNWKLFVPINCHLVLFSDVLVTLVPHKSKLKHSSLTMCMETWIVMRNIEFSVLWIDNFSIFSISLSIQTFQLKSFPFSDLLYEKLWILYVFLIHGIIHSTHTEQILTHYNWVILNLKSRKLDFESERRVLVVKWMNTFWYVENSIQNY